MKSFNGRIAALTGGGTGIGRELVRQLVAEGCSVAMCDVSGANMAETKRLCEVDGVPQGVRITAQLRCPDLADIAIGKPVAVAFEQREDVFVPYFTLG